jgi:hypothetical protein
MKEEKCLAVNNRQFGCVALNLQVTIRIVIIMLGKNLISMMNQIHIHIGTE